MNFLVLLYFYFARNEGPIAALIVVHDGSSGPGKFFAGTKDGSEALMSALFIFLRIPLLPFFFFTVGAIYLIPTKCKGFFK